MRIADSRLLLASLAFVALACAPHRHRGPGHGMMMCGDGTACGYKSKFFSEGAVRSNDGVCQACAGGKWVPATGCQESASHACCGGKETPACQHPHGPRKR